MAELICAAVVPGFSVAQIVVRVGMPPTTPACVQSMARLGSRMPAHGSPVGVATSVVEFVSVAVAVSDVVVERESVVVRPVSASGELLEALEAQAGMQNARRGSVQRMVAWYCTAER